MYCTVINHKSHWLLHDVMVLRLLFVNLKSKRKAKISDIFKVENIGYISDIYHGYISCQPCLLLRIVTEVLPTAYTGGFKIYGIELSIKKLQPTSVIDMQVIGTRFGITATKYYQTLSKRTHGMSRTWCWTTSIQMHRMWPAAGGCTCEKCAHR